MVGAIVAGSGWRVVRTCDRLVRLRNQTQASRARIDVQLKRRHGLIANLVEGARGHAAHERGTFEAVAAAHEAVQVRCA
ncbi:LemA family protein [Streptomyces polyrhachis]|uniref:LemA family protein n=1 Tax=Streptomyces polyrhachis TaxID=1282885 RepID=A0ABW2GMB2_9ACTN